MKLFPYKLVKVTEGLHVKVSNHFYYSDFGIRDFDEMRYNGRRYVMPGAPGTGFIERESESHSYHVYVRKLLALQKPNYWRMLLGKEPDFERELKAANAALLNVSDKRSRELLESYSNALTIAQKEERMERVVRGIKDRMGHHSNKFMVSVMSHYKSKMRQLEHDMDSVVWKVKDHCSPETYEAYTEMVQAFTRVASCRRIWCQCVNKKGRERYQQVYFDLGVFDFIRNEHYLPILRDPNNIHYYILPDMFIVARSSVDFDILPMKSLTVVSQELSIEEPTENMMNRLGDAASMIKIPNLGLDFYFNHVRPVVEFVNALDKLKATL